MSVLHLRGRRGDSDGLISFNLMPVETSLSADPAPIPGRVSDTRLMLVHYWRRDQQAFAEAEAAAILETDAPAPVSDYSTDYSTGNVFVNGELGAQDTHVDPDDKIHVLPALSGGV